MKEEDIRAWTDSGSTGSNPIHCFQFHSDMSKATAADSTVELFVLEQDTCPYCEGLLSGVDFPLYVVPDGGGGIWLPVRPCTDCGRRYGSLEAFLVEARRGGNDPSEIAGFSDWRGELELRVREPVEGELLSWEEYRASDTEFVAEREAGEIEEESGALRIDELGDLPRGRDDWAMGWREGVPLRSGDDDAETLVLALVVDGDGKVRARAPFPAPPSSRQMAGLAEEAALEPEGLREASRPYRLLAGDGVDAAEVEDLLGGTIWVKDGKRPPLVLRLDEQAEKGWQQGSDSDPSFLVGAPPEEVRRFYEAAERVLAGGFWDRFDPEGMIGVRLRDRWHYLLPPDAERGRLALPVFEDWLHAAAYRHNPGHRYAPEVEPDPWIEPEEASTPMDRIVLRRETAMTLGDRTVLEEFGIRPFPPGWWPAAERLHVRNELRRPERDLAFYADLLEALAEVLEVREGEITSLSRTVSVSERDVRLVYPAGGGEVMPTSAGVRFVLEAGEAHRPYERVEVDASTETDLEEVVRQVRGISPEVGFRVEALWKSRVRIYLHELAVSDHPSAPLPVGLLARLDGLRAQIDGTLQPVEVKLVQEVPFEEPAVRMET